MLVGEALIIRVSRKAGREKKWVLDRVPPGIF
jgi:hypothetical protein